MNAQLLNPRTGLRDSGLASLWLCLLLAIPAAAEIIPANRRINWDPGVRGDIPIRTTVFANVKNAPYNARGDGVADDTTAIQNAINACPANQVVYLPAGTYKTSRSLQISSSVTLRGAGMKTTIIKGASTFSGDSMVILQKSGFDSEYSSSPSRSLAATGLTKDSTNITTTAAHGWSVNDIILVDQLENPTGDPPVENNSGYGECSWCGRSSGNRPIGQWTKVTGVPTSTTATIDPPLYFNYDINRSPQAVKAVGTTSMAGVEDVTLDNSVSDAFDTVRMFFVVNCWLSRVEIKGNHRRGIWVYGGLWCTIRGCEIHDGVPVNPQPGSHYTSDRAYGIFMGPWPTAFLLEDNVFHTLVLSVAFEGAASGNVFAYNLCTNMVWSDNSNGRMTVLGHGSHSLMNLVEGNWLHGRFGVDSYWGTQSHFTLYRNRIFQQANKSEQTWVVDVDRRNWYQNIVGNVLGNNGVEDTYELYNRSYAYSYGPVAIYRLGYKEINDNTTGFDTQVKATLLRHGNWDSVNKSTVWDSAIADRTLPPSLYRKSKPAWWGSAAWPSIGPDLAPMATPLPSMTRFYGGSLPKPVPPTGLHVIPQ